MTASSFAPYFSRWRQVSLGGRVVVEGCVDPAHAGPSAALDGAIRGWPGYHYWQRRDGDRWLLLVHEHERTRERWWLHALLLLATILTTSLAAAAWRDGVTLLGPALVDEVGRGLPFALPLLAILGAHELGHFLVARRYRIDASPPYFLPVLPPSINVVGSLGAMVRLRSPIFDRRTLFDVGAAGPLAGLVVTLPLLVYGLMHSAVASVPAAPLAHQFIVVHGDALFLGDSPLVYALRRLLVRDAVVELHPIAAAAWTGLFITMLNLLPLAQFDGGHLAFAALGRAQRWVAWIAVAALVAMGALLWHGWWAWAVLALVAGRGTLAHPRLVSAVAPLDRPRRWAGVLAAIVFLLAFAPVPAQWH